MPHGDSQMFEKHQIVSTIIGELLLVTYRGAIASIDFPGFEERLARLLHRRFKVDYDRLANTSAPRTIATAFDAWAAGSDTGFRTLPLHEGGTEFQRRVWTTLRTIAFGETWSYTELARRIGDTKAVRAVAAANGQNPIAILTPCHRVIGSNGSLTGYAGGLDRKAALLRHEGADIWLKGSSSA